MAALISLKFSPVRIVRVAMPRIIFCLSVFAALLLVASPDARAGEPRLVGTYGKWDAYVFTEGDGKVCYMSSRPEKSSGKYAKRGEVYALITHRPQERTKDVFSYIAGYTYKPGSEATLEVDKTKITLFTQDDTAWAPDSESDRKVSEAIRSGSKMVVKGQSSKGTSTTDSFSLSGSTKAYEKISKECGY